MNPLAKIAPVCRSVADKATPDGTRDADQILEAREASLHSR